MAAKKVAQKTSANTAALSAAAAKRSADEAEADMKKTRAMIAREKAARLKHAGGGFMNFIREQGVVGLAVGLAIGTAAGASVKVIVDQLINPLVALITQGVDLSKMAWTVEIGSSKVQFGWGAVISSLITLFATALVVYLVIRGAKLDRLDKKKDE